MVKLMEKVIFADHAATTYTKNEVIEEMLPYFNLKYGNPSSLHKTGIIAKKAIESARQKIANIINAEPGEIYFTSGGSEADNMIIYGIAMANKDKGNHIITSKIEHHAVLNVCKKLEKEGFEITYLSPDENGIISPEMVRKEIKNTTILVSIMYANNEIGTIEPIEEIAKITKFKGVYFHTDAVQAMGNIEVDVKKLGIDALSMSAHKFYGPKGIGAAFIKKGIKFSPLIYGGHQENEKRAGTENVPGIVGMAKALEIASSNLNEYNKKLITLRDYTLNRIVNEIKDVKINGSIKDRLPGNVNISFKGLDGKSIALMLDIKGIEVSTGSACNSEILEASHVLKAINVNSEYSYGTIRITYGEENSTEDANYIVDSIIDIVKLVRKE